MSQKHRDAMVACLFVAGFIIGYMFMMTLGAK